MCKYIYHEEDNEVDDAPCQLQNYFSLNKKEDTLPLDDLGYCIFHSKNIEWKRKNHFSVFLVKLLEIIDLIDKEKLIYETPNGFLDIDLRGIEWIGNILSNENESEISFKDISFNSYVSLIMHGGHFHDKLIVDKIDANNTTLDFSNCTFENIISITSSKLKDISLDCCYLKGGIDMGQCEIIDVCEFYKMQVKGGFIIHSSTFSDEVKFLYSVFDTNYFSLDNVCFEESTDFSNCVFKHYVYIESCTFGGEVFFYDAVFKKEAKLQLNEYEGNVYFVSHNIENKLFEDIMYIEVKKEELNGLITFENINFLNIAQRDRENLLQLEKANKVIIGKGCIKYRVQSPIITIKANQINQNIITELTTSFSNYFLYSEGINLGVEFVNKQVNNLQLFYYTDELISEDEFINRLKLAEKDYWYFTINNNEKNHSKKIQAIDNYSSKLSVLLKIYARKQFGLWTDNETEELLKSISYNDHSIGAGPINQKIENFIININPQNMEIKEINVSQGGQVNIAERIGKIEFNPNTYQTLSENDFNSLKGLFSKLRDSDINDLKQIIEYLKNDNNNPSKLDLLKEKVTNLFKEHGLPISHSIAASGIFELLRGLLI